MLIVVVGRIRKHDQLEGYVSRVEGYGGPAAGHVCRSPLLRVVMKEKRQPLVRSPFEMVMV